MDGKEDIAHNEYLIPESNPYFYQEKADYLVSLYYLGADSRKYLRDSIRLVLIYEKSCVILGWEDGINRGVIVY